MTPSTVKALIERIRAQTMTNPWTTDDDRRMCIALIAEEDQYVADFREWLELCREEYESEGRTRAAHHRLIQARMELADALACRRSFEQELRRMEGDKP